VLSLRFVRGADQSRLSAAAVHGGRLHLAAILKMKTPPKRGLVLINGESQSGQLTPPRQRESREAEAEKREGAGFGDVQDTHGNRGKLAWRLTLGLAGWLTRWLVRGLSRYCIDRERPG